MGIYHGKNARLYIAGYDIASMVMGVTPVQEREMVAYAYQGVSGYKQMPGLAKDAMSIDGLFDDDYQAVLNSLRSATTGYQVIILFSTTIDYRAVACDAVRLQKYVWKAVVTDINRLTAELLADNLPWDECKLLFPKATKTSDSAHTSIDDTAATTEGAAAYLQVFACGADDDLIVKVQHSTNDSDWNDLITFTTATGITTERKTVDWYDGGEDLAEALDSSETEVDVTDGTQFSEGQTIKVDDEIMYVSSIATNTLTVIRGHNSTAAATHDNATAIYIRTVARYVRASWAGTPTYSGTFAVVYKRN